MQLETSENQNTASNTDDNGVSIRRSLALATCALLGTAHTVPAQAEDWQVDSAVLIYSEADNRVTAIEPVVDARKQIGEEETVGVKLVLDALTGASPNGALPTDKVQTFTSPSGESSYTAKPGETPLDDTFQDTRGSVSVSWEKPINRLLKRTLGASVSSEYDYTSVSANGQLSRDFNARNTTVTAGASVAADLVRPTGGVPIPFASMAPADTTQPREGSSDNKTTLDLLLGVTQVLGHDTIGQLNYSFSDASGYLNDPYKILSVVDGTSGETLDYAYEKRPDNRVKHSLYGEIKHWLGGDIISAAYRFYSDDWGVDSHTADLRYRWSLGGGRYLQPHVRWYTQTAADFFRYSLVSGDPLPDSASADPRLGEYSATTIGLKYGQKLRLGGEWSLRAEYYQQSADDHPAEAIGIQKQFDLFPETSAVILQASYSIKW